MPTARTGEDGRRESRNLEQNEDVDEDEQQEQWEVLDHRRRVGRIDEVAVIRGQDMAEDAQASGGDNLIEAETDERLEPAPEEEVQFVEDEKWDEHRAKESDNRAGDGTVSDDGGNECRQESEQYLRDGEDQHKIRLLEARHHAGAGVLLCLRQRVHHLVGAIRPNELNEVLSAAVDVAFDRRSQSWN